MHMDIKQNSTAPGSVVPSLSLDFILLFKLVFACPSESLEFVYYAPNMPPPSKEIWSLTIFYGFWLELLCWIVSFYRVEKARNMPRDIQLFFSLVFVVLLWLSFSLFGFRLQCTTCMYNIHAHMHTHMHTCTYAWAFAHKNTWVCVPILILIAFPTF